MEMVKFILANYEEKWKHDILREFYYLINEFIKEYNFTLIDFSKFNADSSFGSVLNERNILCEQVESIIIIENHDEILVHHVFSDIYDYKDKLFVFADDIHKNEHLKHENYYENFKKIFVCYREPFLEKYPEISEDKVVWVPHGFTDDHYLKFNNKPLNRVLVSGMKGLLYPLRKYLITKAPTNKDTIAYVHHPKYRKFDYENTQGLKIGSNYGKMLNSYVCCFTDCSSLNYVLAKYFEIPASGSLLLGEETKYNDLEKLGFIDNVNYIKCNMQNIDMKIEWILNPVNNAEIERIRKAGQKLVLEKHHIKNRVKQMNESMNHSVSESNDGCEGDSNNDFEGKSTNNGGDFTTEKENNLDIYCVFGATRNGNRAICYWLQNMLEKSLFINNCNELNISKLDSYLREEESNKFYNDYKMINFCKKQPLLLFYENLTSDDMNTVMSTFTQNTKFIFVIRNPYNFLSSKLHIFIKKKLNETQIMKNLKHDIAEWKKYYFLSCEFPDNVIMYDEWLVDEQYRKEICEKYGLTKNDNEMLQIKGHGKSIFNTKLSNANVDEVLKRYKLYSDNEYYIKYVMSDVELKIMWNSILMLYCTKLQENYTYNKMFNIEVQNVLYSLDYDKLEEELF